MQTNNGKVLNELECIHGTQQVTEGPKACVQLSNSYYNCTHSHLQQWTQVQYTECNDVHTLQWGQLSNMAVV